MPLSVHAALIAVEQQLIAVSAGTIALRDEARRCDRAPVVVLPFRLSQHLLTRELYFSASRASPRRQTPKRVSLRGSYAAITSSPSSSPSSLLPMTDVSWNDAVAFCNLLSSLAGLTPCYSGLHDREAHDVVVDVEASGYRLPFEAEWEYACRAGSADVRYGDLDEIACYLFASKASARRQTPKRVSLRASYADNAGGSLHPVGTKAPNAWGFFDMIGNAWQWCHDVYDPVVYGGYRVFRGGGFTDLPRACRASCRRKSHPTFAIDDIGFRLARRL